ncbi:endoglucanase E-4 [Procambarus clarkii]|uniref:endoglucanase E-4 n=1 Tax=Procambarus clarkii TaxID=6728 RepID=UPI003743C02A
MTGTILLAIAAAFALLHPGGAKVADVKDISNPCGGTGMGPYDYSQLLCMSFVFYEAQRSGKLPGNQRVTWRGDSALNDGSDVGHDLTGGYYDAGDFVKFGFPQAFTATLLAWGLIDFSSGYNSAGQTNYGKDAVKWATDYFLKCHTGYYELYGQVGDGHIDHNYWGRPEEMTMQRPSYKIDSNNPGSELAAETAAALAAASIVFKSDGSYSNTLLSSAKELYQFADEKRGNYANSIPVVTDFYNSWNGYGDELLWAAAWLYRATGDSNYLNKAKQHWNEFGLGNPPQQFSWDSKAPGAYAVLAMADGDSMFSSALQTYMNNIRNSAPYTPAGLVYLDAWGSNRHAANVAFVAFMAAKLNIDASANHAWGKKQIDYMLGTPLHSFVVGYGNNAPQRPHHAAASCPDEPQTCDPNWAMNQAGANPQTLWGALVGGPSQDDSYSDDRADYQHNEVAIDYNAGFTGALAALVENHSK